uniref:uncharacterized protein n=1 Tax=Pristiophorus japonicus TaxID=55135 RepID=UPI00398F8A69
MDEDLTIVWISVGAVLGLTLIAGAALVFCIRQARFGRLQSSPSVHTATTLPAPNYENISLPGRTQFSQKPKELRSANREACTSRKYQTRRFISGQSKTEQVLEKHQHCRELKDQQLQPTQWTHQHQSAPRGHQHQSSLRRFLPFKNLAPPTSNKTLLAPTGSELYANQRQIKPHLSKKKSSDLQADSNSIYMNFDPVLSQCTKQPRQQSNLEKLLVQMVFTPNS